MKGIQIAVRVLALLRPLFGVLIMWLGVSGGSSTLLGVLVTIGGLGVVIYSLQLWKLRKWTWTVEIFLYGVGTVIALYEVIQGGTGSASLLVTAVVNGFIVMLLCRPAARRAFGVDA